MMRMVGTMVDIIVKRIDENMINNMPGGYILHKMNNQNGTSFRHWRWHCHVESSSHFDCSFYLKYNHLACYWSYFHQFNWLECSVSALLLARHGFMWGSARLILARFGAWPKLGSTRFSPVSRLWSGWADNWTFALGLGWQHWRIRV